MSEPSQPATALPRFKGSFIVRQMLRRVAMRQQPLALKTAGRMVLLLPVFQALVQVLVLKSEMWQGLLALEGLLIGWLAASQLSRPDPENRWLGFGVAMLNIGILAAAGVVIGGHLYWISGLAVAIPVGWLVIAPTGKRTVLLAWIGLAVPMLLLLAVSGMARLSLEMSRTETDPASRVSQLDRAFIGLQLRGHNGAERALLRLRQSQAAQEAGDHEAAWHYADDGLFEGNRQFRAIPQSFFAQDLIESLLRMKAISYYNARWDRNDRMRMIIGADPLSEEQVNEPASPIRWGW